MSRNIRSFGRARAAMAVLICGLAALAVFTAVFTTGPEGRRAEDAGESVGAQFSQAAESIVAVARPGVAQAAPAAAVERGKYLVTALGCNDCHTPWKMGANGPEPDMTKMLSGHPEGLTMPPSPKLQEPWMWAGSGTMTAFSGPWGVSYSPNLTSDEETGIGAWDADLFIKAIRNGKFMGAGRPLLPPMPWMWYAKMTDEDLKAIFAYLQTVPAVKNKVPDYTPPAGPGGMGGK